MRPVLSRAQIREVDRIWIERGVPGLVLMENAGRGAAHLIGLKARPRVPGSAPRQGSSVAGSCVRCADERSLKGVRVLVLAGGGNNGGDAFVVARHLAGRAAIVSVFGLASLEQLRGDAQAAGRAMQAVGVTLAPLPPEAEWAELFAQADVIVDGLLGTGADRLVEGRLARLIDAANSATPPVIALDIPSGLDADNGAVLGTAIVAEHTVTFSHLKRGLLTTAGHRHAGTITLSHIGVPSELPFDAQPAARLLERSDVVLGLSVRSRVAHKGTSGRVILLAGSPGTVGAARLASRAALRAGAGLVTVATDAVTAGKLEGEVVEVMTHAWKDDPSDQELIDGAGALVVGPGLGQTGAAPGALQRALRAGQPTVFDADALRMIAGICRAEFDAARPALAVLTPHPGEAAELLGVDIQTVESDRFAAAQKMANEFGSVVVLKGSRTIVAAPGIVPVVSAFGSPVLATAGSGDVLSGVMGAFLVGGTTQAEIFDRAVTAVALHALAAERWEGEHGDRGLLASEVADLVPDVIQQLLGA